MISALTPDSVSSKGAHAATITVIFLFKPPGDRDTIDTPSAFSIPYNTAWTCLPLFPLPSPWAARTFIPFSFFRWNCTMLSAMAVSAMKCLGHT